MGWILPGMSSNSNPNQRLGLQPSLFSLVVGVDLLVGDRSVRLLGSGRRIVVGRTGFLTGVMMTRLTCRLSRRLRSRGCV